MSSRDEFEKWWSSPKRLLHFDWDDESNKWVKLLAEEAWQAAQSKWINVDDRLPEEVDKVYLCYWSDGTIETFPFELHHKGNYAKWGIYHSYVTHWQPLPEPPTDKGE